MVFDTAGKLVLAGADQEINGKKINPAWQHSGGVDWDGNVYVIERDAHRIVKLSPKLDKFLLQLGTTNEKGTDATHLDLPSGIAILHNGNMVVTDGYGNNRVDAVRQDRQVHQAGRQGRRRSRRQGHGARRVGAAAQARRRRAGEPLHHRPRGPSRAGVRQEPDLHPRDRNELEPVGHQHLAQGHRRRARFIADHALERVHKFSLKDGKILATWGTQGLGPGQFDWVHGIVVDSKGAVYAADTYGQRMQKFVPASGARDAGAARIRGPGRVSELEQWSSIGPSCDGAGAAHDAAAVPRPMVHQTSASVAMRDDASAGPPRRRD